MTRDEQIAQLKPGDKVRVPYLASSAPPPELTFLGWHPLTKTKVAILQTIGGRPLVVEAGLLQPPPKPKAVPGQMYRKQVFKNGYHYTFGTPDGRIRYLCEPPFDFDPAIWTPIDDVKVGE